MSIRWIDNSRYLDRARALAAEHYGKHNGLIVSADDFYVVWFAKTLQNWKALVSTDITSGVYYELTHNGDKHETYIDYYTKLDNVAIPDE